MKGTRLFRRVLSMVLALVLLCGMLPKLSTKAATVEAVTVADPGTASAWEHIMGDEVDGTRYAGRVWVDKSVYKDGDVAVLDSAGKANSSFTVDVDKANGEYFQVIFSALGSSMSTNTTISANQPMDVVIVLDTSTSMAFLTGAADGSVRMDYMIPAANALLEQLLELQDIRIAIVTYNADSETVLDLDHYDNGIVLSTNSSTNTDWGGVIYARDANGRLLGNDSGYTMGTNLQDGIDRGMKILANAQNAEGRAPVAIILTDGEANRAVTSHWYDIEEGRTTSDYSISAGLALSTLLNAAYGKASVEANYDTDMTVYGIGVDLDSDSKAQTLMNPGGDTMGFNASNRDEDIEEAYDTFLEWKEGNTARITTGSGRDRVTWTFDHNLPSGGVTSAEVAANINYVDNYQDVSSAELEDAFDSIYDELATGAFNPITDTKNSGTGVEETPLIFVDTIGKYMQIADIQAVRVFDQTYAVTKNADGTYSVAAASGTNPTTNENWSTDNIEINVVDNADGTQQLRIYMQQEILPISLDKVTVKTENGVTVRTLDTELQPPLRIFYTVGIDQDILLPNGQVDSTKIDPDYAYVDETTGNISFYSNAFAQMNTNDGDGDGYVELGDAHVGFTPSHNNRYYYHQFNHPIYIAATNKDGSPIVWDDGDYGTTIEEGKFNLTPMTYADYSGLQDSDTIYLEITFSRPTAATTDGNAAEEVDFLIHTTWGNLKSAVTFHDQVNDVYLNSGVAMENIATTVEAYKNGKTIANTDLVAVTGLEGQRIARLQSMYEKKDPNETASAELAYAPIYSDSHAEQEDIHEHSEVLVWLGNNGKLTLPMATGIQVTKAVTELADGATAGEKFDIQVLLDATYTAEAVADLSVTDQDGVALAAEDYTISQSQGKILVTVKLADGESAYILGMPGGVKYSVTEAEHKKYAYTYKGAEETVVGTIVTGVVTNEPVKPGSLHITKEVEHAVEGEAFPTDYEFEFRVTFVDADGEPIADTMFPMVNNYEPNRVEQKTDANGVMEGKLRHGETVHIKNIPAGATVTVEEVNLPVDGNYTLKSYRSRDYSGAEADADGKVTISSLKEATVVVTNTYTPKPTTVDLDIAGTKIFDVQGSLEAQHAGSFTFLVEKWDGANWTPVTNKTETLEYQAGEGASTKTFTIENVLEGITFDKAGVYTYQVRESIGTIANVTYDRTLYTFTVTVTDVNGQLTAVVTDLNNNVISDGSYDVTFNNDFHSAPVSIDVIKSITDASANPLTSKAGFKFLAQEAEVSPEGVWSVKNGGKSMEIFSDGAGEARFAATYKTEGSYYFIISEVDEDKPGWTYSDKSYQVEVVVTKDATTEDLNASLIIDGVAQNDDNAEITFTNTYAPTSGSIPVDTLVKKQLEGRLLAEGEFKFAIFKDGTASYTDTSEAIMTGTNKADGTVSFTATEYGIDQGLASATNNSLNFSKVGDYFFDIVEITGDLGGVSYDSNIYDMVVEVIDNGDGTLKAAYYFEDATENQVIFNNTYTTEPTQIVIEGKKTLDVYSGVKSLKAGNYTFGLYATDADGKATGSPLQTTTNLANGSFAFAPIPYNGNDIGKTYNYVVMEIAPDGTTDGSCTTGGVTYSGQSFTVSVAIVDNGNGTLTANATGNGAQTIEFVNSYRSQPVNVVLPGKKNLTDRDLTAGEFVFALYKTDKNFENQVLIADDITHDDKGDFQIDLGNLDMGQHYFVVEEVIPAQKAPGIYYYAGVYQITIDVTDSGNGQMTCTKTVVNPGNPTETNAPIVFNNLYRPNDTEVIIDGSKTYNGGKALTDGVFSVGLYDDQDTLVYTAEVKADGSFAFEKLIFTADDVGQTYIYTVKEIIPDGAVDNGDGTMTSGSNIYDATAYTVEIKISDEDKDGYLETAETVTNNGAAAELNFTNTFIPDPIDYVLIANKTYEKGLKANDFTFSLVSADDKTDVDQEKKNDAEGKVTFDKITFENAGEYTFTVKEIDKILGFIEYSKAEYKVTITVVNENGVLRVSNVTSENTKNTNEADLEFVNTYVLSGDDEIVLRGTKNLTGDRTTFDANAFSFALYDSEGNVVETVTNAADGSFVFTALTYDAADIGMNEENTFTYTVKEVPGTDPLITYDTTVYTVVVTVKDNDEGGIIASYTVNGVAEGPISFTNTYTDPEPVWIDIEILKEVENKTEPGIGLDGFQIVLSEKDEQRGVATTDEDGYAGFRVTYTADDMGKTVEYSLSEKNTGVKGVTYDTTVHKVTVQICQNAETGELYTKINGVADDGIVVNFKNIYEKAPTPETGDDFPIVVLLVVLVMSAAAVTVILVTRKKRAN